MNQNSTNNQEPTRLLWGRPIPHPRTNRVIQRVIRTGNKWWQENSFYFAITEDGREGNPCVSFFEACMELSLMKEHASLKRVFAIQVIQPHYYKAGIKYTLKKKNICMPRITEQFDTLSKAICEGHRILKELKMDFSSQAIRNNVYELLQSKPDVHNMADCGRSNRSIWEMAKDGRAGHNVTGGCPICELKKAKPIELIIPPFVDRCMLFKIEKNLTITPKSDSWQKLDPQQLSYQPKPQSETQTKPTVQSQHITGDVHSQTNVMNLGSMHTISINTPDRHMKKDFYGFNIPITCDVNQFILMAQLDILREIKLSQIIQGYVHLFEEWEVVVNVDGDLVEVPARQVFFLPSDKLDVF